jgi:hypothetical protein
MKFMFNKVIEDLIKEYPNDGDLGRKIRQLYLDGEKLKKEKKDGIQQEDTQEG